MSAQDLKSLTTVLVRHCGYSARVELPGLEQALVGAVVQAGAGTEAGQAGGDMEAGNSECEELAGLEPQEAWGAHSLNPNRSVSVPTSSPPGPHGRCVP